jgi:hypothetical protein
LAASRYLITSTRQIAPRVIRQIRTMHPPAAPRIIESAVQTVEPGRRGLAYAACPQGWVPISGGYAGSVPPSISEPSIISVPDVFGWGVGLTNQTGATQTIRAVAICSRSRAKSLRS